MKSFGTYTPPETIGLNFKRLAIPHGTELPPAPVQGELFFLDKEIDGKDARLTFMRGMYFSPGFGWEMYSSQFQKRKAVAIGSRNFEIEGDVNLTSKPTSTEGYEIATAAIRPEHRLKTISGSASFWVSHSSNGYVICSVFRENVLVGFAVQYVLADKPNTMSISFVDSPGDDKEHLYTLRLNSGSGFLYVNQCQLFHFDGASQTAFIVSENN